VVAFETTKGPFSVISRRSWSPNGVDRFHDLVRRGFYDGVTIYRVIDGYVAQFGHTDSAAVNTAWRQRPIDDEPVVAQNTRGRVAFARSGPRSRTYQLYINTGENSPRLDTLTAQGITGYPPIAEVIAGIETVLAFESRWGNEPSSRQDSIAVLGRAYLDRVYPGLDRILSATVVRTWR
jgi:cyclophilin family peptidyl-prolyl cis-trans isomerase